MSSTTRTPDPGIARSTPPKTMVDLVTALSMLVGRGAAARGIADLAQLGAHDRVVDIGCGPGAAAREAAHRGATATGVDPLPIMLRLARWITAMQRLRHVVYVRGSAEHVPVADGAATVVWALSSVHHWSDRAAGLSEAHRVLARGGRVLLRERLVKPGARGHSAHGLTSDQAAQLADQMRSAGFSSVRYEIHRQGRKQIIVVSGVRNGTSEEGSEA